MKGSTGFVKPLLLILAAVALIVVIVFTVAYQMGGEKNLGQAVDFSAEDAVGEEFTLSKTYGQGGVALIFFDREQGDGKALLTNLSVAKQGKKVTTVLVAVGEKGGEQIQKYLAENSLSADVIIPDEKRQVADLYNVTTCPITYFIDTTGSVRSVSLSNLTPSAAEKYMGYID